MDNLGPSLSTGSIYAAADTLMRYYDILWERLEFVMCNIYGKNIINKKQLLIIMWYQNVNVFTVDDFTDENSYDTLIDLISQRTNLDRAAVINAMDTAYEAAKEHSVVATLIPSYEKQSCEITKVNVGRIGVRIPTKVLNRIFKYIENEKNKDDMIARLFIRYSIFGLDSGFFWSAPVDLYRYLAEDSKIHILECFASPFNHGLSNYCSLFPEDISFRSLGNFFDYIDELTNRKIKCRLLINPPYTIELIDQTVKVVIKYLNDVPGGEAFFMLPTWNRMCARNNKPLEPISILEEHPAKQSFRVYSGNYRIYSYMDGGYIQPPMDIDFISLSSPGTISTIDIEKVKDIVMFNRITDHEDQLMS